jgi:hypothetical protein
VGSSPSAPTASIPRYDRSLLPRGPITHRQRSAPSLKGSVPAPTQLHLKPSHSLQPTQTRFPAETGFDNTRWAIPSGAGVYCRFVY